MHERERGRESFEISEFFKKDLENEIILNFNNLIDRTEYEEIVYSVFGASAGKRGRITAARVHKEVEKLVRQYRMRSKKEILQKVMTSLRPLPSEVELLRNLVKKSYNTLMEDPVRLKINALVREGTTDFRMVLSALRRDNIEIDKEVIGKILVRAVNEYELSRAKVSRSPRKVSKIDLSLRSGMSPLKKRLKEQMRKTLMRKARFKKEQFMKAECPKFRFKLTDKSVDNDRQILEHSGETEYTHVAVRTEITHNKMTDMQVTCTDKQAKQGAGINIFELRKMTQDEKKFTYLQRWLKKAFIQMHYMNIQEVIWFLQGVLNERFGLPDEISNLLSTHFIQLLKDFDRSINKAVIEKALEKV